MLFSCSVMSDSLWPYGLQHTRLPCPSLSPRVCSNSCSLSRWCHPTISSSVTHFSCHQSFPASGSFPVSRLFASGGQSIGASETLWPRLGLRELCRHMHVCECVYVCMYICICVWVCVCMHVGMPTQVCVHCAHVCILVGICNCTSICYARVWAHLKRYCRFASRPLQLGIAKCVAWMFWFPNARKLCLHNTVVF